jgi:hypothetical protein
MVVFRRYDLESIPAPDEIGFQDAVGPTNCPAPVPFSDVPLTPLGPSIRYIWLVSCIFPRPSTKKKKKTKIENNMVS